MTDSIYTPSSSEEAEAVAEEYFRAWKERDWGALRAVLHDEATFRGPLGSADNGDECLSELQGMAELMTDLVVLKRFVNGPDVLTWFDLYTGSETPAPTANWSHVEEGKIVRIRVTFDPRNIALTPQ